MDIEHLSKHQIVLLAFLVSFVSSIVTGIVTVTLLGQAPPGVTRTINQIVERTVQTVVPATQGAAATTVTQKTVVVKDDDLTAQSIATVQKSIVRIVGKGDNQLIARGVIISNKGDAITDAGALDASAFTDFEAIMPGGERVAVTLPKAHGTSTPLLMVSLAVGTSTDFAPASIADVSKLELGQSVIRIGGTGTDIAGAGIVAALPAAGSSEIEASVGSSVPGSLIMTLFGDVIGLATTQSLNDGSDFYTLVQPPMTAATSTATKASSGS
jgi:hypothetical protein